MKSRLPIAWLQLKREKVRLAVAVAGVAFAVLLVFMQLGFRNSVLTSATRYHRVLDFDLVLVSPETAFLGRPSAFTHRRLYQALAAEEVSAVCPVRMRQGFWKNPWEHNSRSILVMGVDPLRDNFVSEELSALLPLVRRPDVVIFDALSRPEFGPVADAFAQAGTTSAEINHRRVEVAEVFHLGSSFGVDGSVVTSDLNFQRIFPNASAGEIQVGLIHLHDDADLTRAQLRLEAALDDDVLVLTRDEFLAREVEYWQATTPVGYVFGLGAIMGLVVGGVVVYQILFADVTQHRTEYATLKAIGYANADLASIVLQQAMILSFLGFVPGLLISQGLYRVTSAATRLPMGLTPERVILVFAVTLAMCGSAGLLAIRKVSATDPAEVFA